MRSEHFSIGDRVEYVSPDEPEYNGLTGTIEEVDMTSSTGEEFAYMIFDNEMEDTVPLSKLKPIMKGINKMKKIKESNDVTLDEVAKEYGTDVAKALVRYCREMKTTPDEVLNDMTEDRKGMTKWDRFDTWANRKLGLDVMGNFDDKGVDWTGAEEDRRREKEMVDESSRMTDQDILDWIGQEVSEAEWCTDMTFDDYDPTLEVETMDGDRFEIKVNPLEGGTKEDVMLESEDKVSTDEKIDLVELIEEYAKEMENKAKGDRTAGMAAKIARDKLMDLISSL